MAKSKIKTIPNLEAFFFSFLNQLTYVFEIVLTSFFEGGGYMLCVVFILGLLCYCWSSFHNHGSLPPHPNDHWPLLKLKKYIKFSTLEEGRLSTTIPSWKGALVQLYIQGNSQFFFHKKLGKKIHKKAKLF